VFIPDLWMPVHLGTFYLWIGGPSLLTDVIAVLLINYVFLILSGIIVYGLYATYRPQRESSDDVGARYRRIISRGLLWGFVAVLCVQLFYPRGAYKFYLLALGPFLAILFDYKNLDLQDSSEFVFQKHHLVPIVMTWAVVLCFRFVYFWLIAAWGIFYLWKAGELRRIVSGGKTLISGRLLEDDLDISELEEIYSE
jgi:hypothetical protein